MPQHLSPAARARARRLDQALDADQAGRGRNRDRATEQLSPSHADPGSHTLPNTHGAQVADRQPNQHSGPPTGAPPPAARPEVSPAAPSAAPTPTSPAPLAAGDGGGAGQGGSP